MPIRAYRLSPLGMDVCTVTVCEQLATHGIPTRDREEILPFCDEHTRQVLALYPDGPEFDAAGLELLEVLQ